MKPLLLALLLLAVIPTQNLESKIKTFRNHSRFSVKYDKFKDRTVVDVGPFVVGGDMKYALSGSRLYMTGRFSRSGSEGKSPATFSLWFRATGRDWEFLKTRNLYALIDGTRFDLGEGKYDADLRRRNVSESLGFPVPVDVFQKLGAAKSAELKIGRIELTLKDEHKEAFRDLLSLS